MILGSVESSFHVPSLCAKECSPTSRRPVPDPVPFSPTVQPLNLRLLVVDALGRPHSQELDLMSDLGPTSPTLERPWKSFWLGGKVGSSLFNGRSVVEEGGALLCCIA